MGGAEFIRAHLSTPLSLLILQILVVLVASRIAAFLFRRIGQPAVVGEMAAGIALGPSIFGAVYQEGYLALFPPEAMGHLNMLSHIGLILFIFMIGMEFDLPSFKTQARTAFIVSHAGMLVPFALGFGLSMTLSDRLGVPGGNPVHFALFMGVAMSITAFPVLARLIQERELTRTTLGSMALASAAVGDLSAWIMLGLVIALVQAKILWLTVLTVGLAAAFILLMYIVVRPLLNRVASVYASKEIVGRGVMAGVLGLVFASALFTEAIGIHALFGAFVAGIVMPVSSKFRRIISGRIEDFAVSFLLPLFFASVGLRTNVNVLLDLSLLPWFGLILGVAILGKLGGASLSAWASGMGGRTSLALGILLNARGLMELVVLNMGAEIGLLSPAVFSMMVVMALVTTFMTNPLLSLVLASSRSRARAVARRTGAGLMRIMIPFGPPEAGVALMRIASGLTGKTAEPAIIAAHFAQASDFSIQDDKLREEKMFVQVARYAAERRIKYRALYQATTDVGVDIVRKADEIGVAYIIMGAAHTIFGDNKIGGKVGEVLRNASCGVGILVDNGLQDIVSIVVLHARLRDEPLLEVAGRFKQNKRARITVVDRSENKDLVPATVAKYLGPERRKKPRIVSTRDFDENPLELARHDLIIMSVNYWLEMKYGNSRWLQDCPASLLLVRPARAV